MRYHQTMLVKGALGRSVGSTRRKTANYSRIDAFDCSTVNPWLQMHQFSDELRCLLRAPKFIWGHIFASWLQDVAQLYATIYIAFKISESKVKSPIQHTEFRCIYLHKNRTVIYWVASQFSTRLWITMKLELQMTFLWQKSKLIAHTVVVNWWEFIMLCF